MLGGLHLFVAPVIAQTTVVTLPPFLILAMCIIAGIGTVFLLPGHRSFNLRGIGGLLLMLAALMFFAKLLPLLAAGGSSQTTNVYFWIFAAIAIFAAIRVITHPRPVYSALYFVLAVFASAGLFVLMEAEFMAAALVLIYAGAILITYVFVIMLASQASTETENTPATQMAEYDNSSRDPLAAAAIGFALMGVLLFVIFNRASGSLAPVGATIASAADQNLQNAAAAKGVTQELGVFLFRTQLVQLEVAGLILTIAMVGAIMIARRQVMVPATTIKKIDTIVGPATPVDDNPHSIPVYGTDNPRQKAYPQT